MGSFPSINMGGQKRSVLAQVSYFEKHSLRNRIAWDPGEGTGCGATGQVLSIPSVRLLMPPHRLPQK